LFKEPTPGHHQQGANVDPASVAAKGINMTILGTKIAFALYLTLVKPQVMEDRSLANLSLNFLPAFLGLLNRR
jgi:hypothetical protein